MARLLRSLGPLCVIAVLALVAGCGSEEPPAKPNNVTDPNAPPPPTPEQISKRVITELGLDQPLPPPGSRLTAAARASTLEQYKRQHTELSKTPEGQAALVIVQRTLEDRITALERAEFWEHAVTFIDAFEIFQPDSRKYKSLHEKAMRELRRPRITLKGLPQVDGHVMAILTIYVPLTSESFDERLSEGEEMHGIRFLEVFGNDRGIRVEFTETGERQVIYLRSQQ